MNESSADLGCGKPPAAMQFKKGVSGNPRGRPRKRYKQLPYDVVLGRMVTVRENGRERRITAAEAFILQLTKKGLEGCGASARASLASIEQARQTKVDEDSEQIAVTLCYQTFGICCSVEDLGMAVRLNATSKQNVRLMLKPWIVEAALTRPRPQRFTLDEQRTIWSSTQSPTKVKWPEWWQWRG